MSTFSISVCVVNNLTGDEFYTPVKYLSYAKALVKKYASDDTSVYIMGFRRSDSQHMFYNRDGGWALEGQPW